MTALRIDRRQRAALRRRAPKPPTGALLVYRVALRRALGAQQARLWAIIERNYEEPKEDGYGASFTFTVDQADEAKLARYRRILAACYAADCVSELTFTITGGGVITSNVESEHKNADSLGSPPIFHTDAAADGGASKLKGEHIAIAPKTLDLAAGRVAKHAVDETARLLGVQFKGGEKRRVPGGISRASQGADKDVVAAFRRRNLGLIRKLERQQVDELRGVLEEATEKSWPVKTLRARVMERFAVTKSHADLIARDQILKLNGQLQEMRQTKAGITEYVWSTSNDERVRPEHAELDGQRFSWDDPPESGPNGEHEHPGQGISCRCVAIPVVPWLEDE